MSVLDLIKAPFLWAITLMIELSVRRTLERIHRSYRPRILLLGYARHGKDTVADMLKNYGMTFTSSSIFAARLFVYDALADKYGYKSVEECFNDRVNHRTEWYELIKQFNADNPARLATEILKVHDIYCGMRDDKELQGCKKLHLFTHTFWVDASKRKEPESLDSCKVTEADADVVIDNNSSLLSLRYNLAVTMKTAVSEYVDKLNSYAEVRWFKRGWGTSRGMYPVLCETVPEAAKLRDVLDEHTDLTFGRWEIVPASMVIDLRFTH